ncbi:MAG TPA: helix-turn-helix transcriptional regulator, partial [Polyangiaceae bacterium]|nr:helix-turn-helix transcriptional regulator [Polyangiaceae bacterium]
RKTVRGVRCTVPARFRLGAAEAALGAPASELAGRIVALEDLWGEPAARRVLEQMAGARDVVEAAAALDRAIAERVATAAASRRLGSLALDAAGQLRSASFTAASVSAVAEELGVSERHLRRVFRDAFGVAPKTFAKLARFNHALRAARENQRAGWASIAASAGYYDQAHLIAEFRAIAGVTPRALLGELGAAVAVP